MQLIVPLIASFVHLAACAHLAAMGLRPADEMGGAIKETRAPTPDLERSSEGDLGELNDRIYARDRISNLDATAISHCLSLPLIACLYPWPLGPSPRRPRTRA